ncbi:uncharacterized protein LOC128873915 [Hylaeus volcanicus]|uniref:uncharacterized protein LOC128873915 n=1 Tax=Hylaeus volcanicus TaxID=313075 RepID=UPI0023B8059E|nr:uncharacterized protein LOC128873915 [Hylaeus volcanicus]
MFGLYLLDVYVTKLILNKEVYVDTGGSPLIVKVVFINFPAMTVVERKRHRRDDDIFIYEFKNGQSCHFSMICEELVKKMKKVPINIGVFREDDEYPICYVRTHLTGCACDLGELKVDRPKSFTFRGPFDLVDNGNSFAGQLSIDITITSMGRCMMRYYALAPNCFLFKTGPEENEYKCNFKETSRIADELLYGSFGDNVGKVRELSVNLDTDSPGSLVTDIVGITPAAGHLANGSPPPQPPREPLVDPRLVRKRRRKGRKKGKK